MVKANAVLLREAGSDRLHVHKITEDFKVSPKFVDLGEGGKEYEHILPDNVVFVKFSITPLNDGEGFCAFTIKELNSFKLEKEGKNVTTASQALKEKVLDSLVERYNKEI